MVTGKIGKAAELVARPGVSDAQALRSSIKMEGAQRVFEAKVSFDNPPPGVVVDGTALLQKLMSGAESIDAARVTIDVRGLQPGQEYELFSLKGLQGNKRIGVELTINVDIVPKDSKVTNLALTDNHAPLSNVSLNGAIGTVAGSLVNVSYETFRV